MAYWLRVALAFVNSDYVKVKVLRCSVCQQPRSQNNGRFALWSGNETIHLLAHARVRDQVHCSGCQFSISGMWINVFMSLATLLIIFMA